LSTTLLPSSAWYGCHAPARKYFEAISRDKTPFIFYTPPLVRRRELRFSLSLFFSLFLVPLQPLAPAARRSAHHPVEAIFLPLSYPHSFLSSKSLLWRLRTSILFTSTGRGRGFARFVETRDVINVVHAPPTKLYHFPCASDIRHVARTEIAQLYSRNEGNLALFSVLRFIDSRIRDIAQLSAEFRVIKRPNETPSLTFLSTLKIFRSQTNFGNVLLQ
jgi:hypothetical protein